MTFSLARSAAQIEVARASLARGVGSAARLRTLSPSPVIVEADGPICRDLDGNSYKDFVMALGPLLLGHRPTEVLDAVRGALDDGSVLCGGPHPGEGELARLICETLPCAEQVVYSTSGSEAVQAAIRIARATTGRRIVVKFEGHYNGWIDPVFVNAPGVDPEVGPPPLRVVPNVQGALIPNDVIVAPWNDQAALEAILTEHGAEVACVIMEPVPCNFGTILPKPGYLEAALLACRASGALLVFDEVVTGYRLSLGGAQELLGVTPDLTVIAKAVASGFPLSAVAGTSSAMASAVDGPVHHGGTYNASGTAVTAAIETIKILRRDRADLYPRLDELGRRLAVGIADSAARQGMPLVANQVGSVIQLLWRPRLPIRSYSDARTCDQSPVAVLSDLLLSRGVLSHERGLWFLSTAHSDAEVDFALAAVDDAFDEFAYVLEVETVH